MLKRIASWLLILLFTSSTAYYDIDDSLLYKIEFPGIGKDSKGLHGESESGILGSMESSSASPPEAIPQTLKGLDDDDQETVVITSVDNEKFKCTLPKVKHDKSGDSSEYTGSSVLGLLEKLFVQQTCAYRLESYWTYELCHGKHLRQYHEERDGKNIKVQEYYLGKFTKEMLDGLVADHERDTKNDITRHPPTKKIEGLNMPYYEILMTDGTICDLNNLPRRTRVLYVCYPAGKNEIYSLKEVSTCEYEVVVLTNILCSHPSYKPEESKEHSIACRPIEEGQPRKPAKLTKLEVESLKLRSERLLEAHLSGGDGPGKVKIEIRPVQVDIEGLEGQEDLQDTIDRIKEGQWKEANREPFKPLMDPQVVKQFLKGEYCLYGGSGWWKYEFCYGMKVDQYHEEGNGKRTVINLGKFNKQDHISWLEQHPTKKPKEVKNRKQVSIFYSNGDVCDLTGKPRQIEVKLKCKPADSPSTVSLYLLEPKVCEYVLGVESPLVCDLLPHADDATGLFPVGIVDNVGTKEFDKEKSPSESTKTIFTKEDLKTLERLNSKNDAIFDKISKDIMSDDIDTLGDNKKNSKVTQESVKFSEGIKTIVRKVSVNGKVISTETIKEKDGTRIQHDVEVTKGEDDDEYKDAESINGEEEDYDSSEDIDDNDLGFDDETEDLGFADEKDEL